jgi:hypothetical protein
MPKLIPLMKTTKYTYPAVAAFACGIAVLAGLGTAMAIIKSGVHSSDAATWVGAMGTIGAVVAALWIATDQDRNRRNDSVVAAQVAAAGMLQRTKLARVELNEAASWFQTCESNDGNTAGFLVFLERLEKLPTWPHDELVRLAPLPGKCAYKMAAALDKAHAALAFIRIAVAQHGFTSNRTLRLQHAAALAQILTEAVQCLDSALEQLQTETRGLLAN